LFQSVQLNIHINVGFVVELTDVSTGIEMYPKFRHISDCSVSQIMSCKQKLLQSYKYSQKLVAGAFIEALMELQVSENICAILDF
jgi:hypothetical protein